MDKAHFLQHARQELLQVFENSKQYQKDNRQKHRIEGFLYAGQLLGVVTAVEAKALMEEAHFQVFGETTEQRAERKANLLEALQRGDDAYIDIPSYERNRR